MGDVKSIIGYNNQIALGSAASRLDAEPIFEGGKCGDAYLPMRMYIDTRCEENDVLPHVHRAIEILCMISGEMHMIINNESYDVKGDYVILLNSDDVHMITGAEARYYVIQIEPDILNTYGVDIRQYMPRTHKILKPDMEYNAELTDWIKNAFAHIGDCGKTARIAVLSDIFGMFSLIMTYSKQFNDVASETRTEQKVIVRLKEVFSYVDEHYDEDITVDEISDHVHLTKTYFCRFFKRATGTTFIEYLNKYRCNRVEELMRNSDLSITTIASRAGFKNISYFNKTYKKIRGESPSKNRKQIFGTDE